MSSDAVEFFVPSILASCTVAVSIGAVFRYARRTSTALPDEMETSSSFLKWLARRRSWVFLTALRRFVPADE